ncbi:glycosyltransferase family 4 protein [Priestia endophytica]|uniref:Glycosyl transferase n=1 Tax=Priestia endophytica TaxID=135735 RepID=A0AAX1Q3R0_9BACI|nr:glycosyltransferase family 4 protein [Priestia endophytica]RAS72755.1 glycosyl transferase [Priestia endophytica]RAS83155.1 glycosyl transferase [Priestia endophytica]
MKILLATYWVVPHLGGVWNYMGQLKRKLESLGHEVDLLGYGENNNYIHLVNEDRKINRDQLLPLVYANLTKQPPQSNYADALVRYCDISRRVYELGVSYLGLEKYDIIHTQDVYSTACINRIRGKKTPLVATLHGCVAHEMKHHIMNNMNRTSTSAMACSYFDDLEHEGSTSAEITIVANNWLKRILTDEFHAPSEQIQVFHYGYDTKAFLERIAETESHVQRPNDKAVILYTGRLVELKGVHHLISALGRLKKLRNDWICWVVGEGEDQDMFRAQSKSLELENDIIFLGRRNDIPYLLSESDIFVFPSLIENQPLSVIEAQITGNPVIVSDTGGLPEMVQHGVTGLIYPKGDIEKLSNNINLLLQHKAYRETLGNNAKKWGMNHWSLDQGVKNVVKVYEQAIFKRKNI